MLIRQHLDPIVLVLDEAHRPITMGTLQLDFVDGNMFKDNSIHMLGEFRTDDNARYVVGDMASVLELNQWVMAI